MEITENIKKAIGTLQWACSKHTVDTCPECPLYIKFQNRGCIFNQRRCPEFFDDWLLESIPKKNQPKPNDNPNVSWNGKKAIGGRK